MLQTTIILLLLLLLYVQSPLFSHVEQPTDPMHLLLLMLRALMQVLIAVGAIATSSATVLLFLARAGFLRR
jgi:hypothetical protein